MAAWIVVRGRTRTYIRMCAGANLYDCKAYGSCHMCGNCRLKRLDLLKKVWSGEVGFTNNESFFVNLMGNHIELNLSYLILPVLGKDHNEGKF